MKVRSALALVVAVTWSVGFLQSQPMRLAHRRHSQSAHPRAGSSLDGLAKTRVANVYSGLPLRFEVNRGQFDEKVKFLSHGIGYNLFLTSKGAVLTLAKAQSSRINERRPLEENNAGPSGVTVLTMELLGANPSPAAIGFGEPTGRANYFIGKDPKKWRTGIPTYPKVRYQEVYPGIDLIYYGNRHQLEFDFLVEPGADPKGIRIAFSGAETIHLDGKGDLVLHANAHTLTFKTPVTLQEGSNGAVRVPGRYVFKGEKEVGFELASYDPDKLLIIDPVLIYSTYLGGSQSDQAWDIAVDTLANAYITGQTWSLDFPPANPVQGANGGLQDVFIAKVDAEGAMLVYSTYLGGSEEDVGYGITVDDLGNAYVTGETRSNDFPTANPIQGTYGGLHDAFVAKLSADGSALTFSTYLGGSSEDVGYSISADGLGNAYVTGQTSSADFPTVNPVQGVRAGSYDAFVTKFNASGSAILYSTFLGGTDEDAGYGIAADDSEEAYITGSTYSGDFPIAGAIQGTKSGSADAFVTKLSSDGAALAYSTYLGGNFPDEGWGIAVDNSGNAYVTGQTSSSNFPIESPIQWTNGGWGDAFVTKLNPDGTALVYSTYLGGSKTDRGYDIAVDASENVYVAGETSSLDFPITNAVRAANAGSEDAFVTKLNAAGSALLYSTYLGGSAGDSAYGIDIHGCGSVYIAALTNSFDFPMGKAIQEANAGYSDAFVVRIQDFHQQRCIRTVNKRGARVAMAQGKENTKCVRDAGSGRLLTGAEECLTADTRGRVRKVQQKSLDYEASKCIVTPSFGYTGAANGNSVTVTVEISLLHDIFGPDLDAAIIPAATDRGGAKCQAAVVKGYEKLAATQVKQFLACKRHGLFRRTLPQIIDGGGIADCFWIRSESIGTDPKGKVTRAASRLRNTVLRKCSTVNIASAFPGSCGGAEDFTSCVDERVSCCVCQMLDAMDDINADCDLFDDGEDNDSCAAAAPTTSTSTTTTTTTTT